MKKAFTMIELIFVIVIIGILAAVAMPKLSSHRDTATAGICAEEIASIVNEIITRYGKLGYTEFQALTISALSNTKTRALPANSDSGITEDGMANVISGINYICEGGATATLGFTTFSVGSKEYNLTVTPVNTSDVPAAFIASEIIAKNFKISQNSTINIQLSK